MAPQTTSIELLNRLYGRFNARDIPAVLHDDVAWADGRAAVRRKGP